MSKLSYVASPYSHPIDNFRRKFNKWLYNQEREINIKELI